MIEYLTPKANTIPGLASTLPKLLSDSATARIGLILTERFINMPPDIVPPMYKMLLEEIEWAVQEGEPYSFSHYLILSKTYIEVASNLQGGPDDDDENNDEGNGARHGATRPAKRKKRKQKEGTDGSAPAGGRDSAAKDVFYFHWEDEVLQRHALGFGGFRYEREGEEGAGDAKRAFQEAGIKPLGHVILIEAEKFKRAIRSVEQYVGG